MKSLRPLLLALAVAMTLSLTLNATPFATGTATVTTSSIVNPATNQTTKKVSIAWTSSAGGAVSGNTFTAPVGDIVQVKFVPGTGGTTPTNLYDVTLIDTDGFDLLEGAGANLSSTAASFTVPVTAAGAQRVFYDGAQVLDLVVANAGNAKNGTVILWIR